MNQMSLKKNQSLVSTLMDGEMVLLDLDTGDYFVLNKVGAFIWDLLNGDITIDGVAGKVVERFDVSLNQANNDIRHFLNELQKKGMVTVDEGA
jgi:hypothetical protein